MANQVNWFEIPVSDLNRAKKFYADVMGYEYDDMEMKGMQMAMFSGSSREEYGATGALVFSEGYKPSADGTVVYLGTEDLDVELAKIEGAGGKILSPKVSIGEHGFIAHFLDTEGNHLALHSMK